MNQNKPVLLGGLPVRTKPYVVDPKVDHHEEEMVLKAVRELNFSRYIGADSPDLEQILRMPSDEAAALEARWHFLGGQNVRQFGADFAKKFGVKFAIPVSNCTTGIMTALAATGCAAGDEVIIPGMSFTATGTAPLFFNSIPVFADVDPLTFCLDPKQVEASITPRTKAILPVHLLGNACDMDAILAIAKKHGLRVVEDCAQAPGTKYRGRFVGSLGDAGVFSFQQSKNIMTGEGGMITTNDPEVARRCRLIINHGEAVIKENQSDSELLNIVGCNFRMPELCAAVGIAQLKKLDEVNEHRNRNARYLMSRLSHVKGLIPPHVDASVDWVCHVLSYLYDEGKMGLSRDLFLAALRAEGIPVGTGYVRAMYENPLFLRRMAFGSNGAPWTVGTQSSTVQYSHGQCPVIEELLGRKFVWFYHVAYPNTEADLDDIVTAVNKVLEYRAEIVAHSETIKNQFDTGRKQGRI